MTSPLSAPQAATSEGSFVVDPRLPYGSDDPVYGRVQQGSVHGMWAVQNPALGIAQLTDGARVVTPTADGSVWDSPGILRRRARDRHVDLDGHRFTLHHTSLRRAVLRRDGLAICWLHRTRAGHVWQRRRLRTYEVEHWSDRTDRLAAAAAHLLASRYGVGSPGVLINTFALLTLPFRFFR